MGLKYEGKNLHPTHEIRGVATIEGGFVAGTLVHTKEGLTPIEHINIGDRVLSRPKGKNKISYTPVVDTVVFEEKPIRLIRFYVVDPKMPEGGKIDQVATTADYPFRVNGVGWTRADALYEGREIELHNGTCGWILAAAPLMRTESQDVAWGEGLHGVMANDSSGDLVRFEKSSIDVGIQSWRAPESLVVLEDGTIAESSLFRRKVYNLEVASNRTYCVGELGIWVRNSDDALKIGADGTDRA